MPELPEVEHLRRSLVPHLLGRRVLAVEVRRRDLLCPLTAAGDRAPTDAGAVEAHLLARTLLVGCTIIRLRRHGKQLSVETAGDDGGAGGRAVVGAAADRTGTGSTGAGTGGPALVVHLGMTGQLLLLADAKGLPPGEAQGARAAARADHADRRGRSNEAVVVAPSAGAIRRRGAQDRASGEAEQTTAAATRPAASAATAGLAAALSDPHVHVVWTLGEVDARSRGVGAAAASVGSDRRHPADPPPSCPEPGGATVGASEAVWARLVYRDIRRFGAITLCPGASVIDERLWSRLGPDALTIEGEVLYRALRRTRRAVKAALLDQGVIAGLGNIYVDESLFAAGVHPLARADRLTRSTVERLAEAIRAILEAAITAGGSTLRDYVDAEGLRGGFQTRHRVYGRAGEPCVECGRALERMVVAQRGTTFCRRCQPRRG